MTEELKLRIKASEPRQKVLISFSGGETSAYMTWWLWTNKQAEYEMQVVYANTGEENEETLLFIKQFSAHFNIPVVWVEAQVYYGQRKANTANIVDFQSASRKGEPYERIIAKHGIPNRNSPHCTRELKLRPIQDYAKNILKWKNYHTAIGIRADEMDRMNPDRKDIKVLYPLCSEKIMTKPDVNLWWSQQPFRLLLKGYQGNCKWCWKKSKNKLLQIAKENPEAFKFPEKMERLYGNFIPATRIERMKQRGKTAPQNLTFFREGKSAIDIVGEARSWDGVIQDDTKILGSPEFDFDNESCDVFSTCGSTKENEL